MSAGASVEKGAQAVSMIDGFLINKQRDGKYDRWLERYTKAPNEHDDFYLFGKLVQAMFSGGMKGEVVDQKMPSMAKAFHNWDIRWIASLSEQDILTVAELPGVIGNKPKLRGVVSNAKRVCDIVSDHGSFGEYLCSFDSVKRLAKDLSSRFSYLGPVTTEDFLRNIGFDTAKPDRHLQRWLGRMGIIDSSASSDEVINMLYDIAEAADMSRAHVDSAIYLFCADRSDVLAEGGICGAEPKCERCPVTDLCGHTEVADTEVHEQAESM